MGYKDESEPGKVEKTSEHVYLGDDVGQTIPLGKEEEIIHVEGQKLQTEKFRTRTLHDCQHVDQNDAFARCCVTNRTICSRPECSARCSVCKNIVCVRHYTIIEGRVVCHNCNKPASGDFDWVALIIGIVIAAIIIAYLLSKGHQ
jgi:hypothetical protein